MRKLLWLILLFAAYVWVMTSGHEQFVIQQGRVIYQALIAWFDDAEVDFQVKRSPSYIKSKKKSRRWD